MQCCKQIPFVINYFLVDCIKIEIVLCLVIYKFAIKTKLLAKSVATVDMMSPLLLDIFLIYIIHNVIDRKLATQAIT